MSSLQQALSLGKGSCLAAHCAGTVSTINGVFGPSVDDQAVSLSDDGTTIIIDFFSFGPSGAVQTVLSKAL